jgi:hypothetical protein
MYSTIIFFLSHRPFVLAVFVESSPLDYFCLKIVTILKKTVAKYTFFSFKFKNNLYNQYAFVPGYGKRYLIII